MGMNNLSALSQSVNGNPTLERLQAFADALDVPITELFEALPASATITCPNCGHPIEVEVKARR
jgi:transcriptional regulator with XRE-family HTH domain